MQSLTYEPFTEGPRPAHDRDHGDAAPHGGRLSVGEGHRDGPRREASWYEFISRVCLI